MSDDGEVPFVDLGVVHRPVLDELHRAFERVLTSSTFMAGREVEAFEAALAERVGVTSCVLLGSGTAALHLALLAAGVGAGDEVILPPNTFFATAEAVAAVGARPVFADVDPATAQIDPDAVAAAVTDRTAAIIGVDLYGHPAPMTQLQRIADAHGLLLLEDAAQAIGATLDDRPAGSLGAAAGFSFYPGKNLGALGEAGAVTTDDQTLAQRIRELRSHGERAKHVHVAWGFNERPDELQAAFLNVKLAQLDEAQRLRDEAVARYTELLAAVPSASMLRTASGVRHVHHLMVVTVPDRDRVLQQLRADGVAAAVHYPTPIHLQPVFEGGWKRGQLPHAERLADSILSLPLFAGITDQQVERSVNTLAQALRRAA